MTTWNPNAYLRFAEERSRPFHDLLTRVYAERPRTVIDLGCGPGKGTASLVRRWPEARVTGVDASEAMIAAAKQHGDSSELSFELADIATWEPSQRVDVIVANAVLQWIPNHLELLAHWVTWLTGVGWMALQVPANYGAPSHLLMRDVAQRPAYVRHLDGVLRSDPVAEPAQYAEVLMTSGLMVDCWETTYLHVLDREGHLGEDAVLAWMAGTGLRPVFEALADDPELRKRFAIEYGAELRRAYPRQPWGTPLPFRRIFAVGHRRGSTP